MAPNPTRKSPGSRSGPLLADRRTSPPTSGDGGGTPSPIWPGKPAAACHWRRVMIQGSYENAGTVARLIARLVGTKPDREAGREVDPIFMAALAGPRLVPRRPRTMFLDAKARLLWGSACFPRGPLWPAIVPRREGSRSAA